MRSVLSTYEIKLANAKTGREEKSFMLDVGDKIQSSLLDTMKRTKNKSHMIKIVAFKVDNCVKYSFDST